MVDYSMLKEENTVIKRELESYKQWVSYILASYLGYSIRSFLTPPCFLKMWSLDQNVNIFGHTSAKTVPISIL